MFGILGLAGLALAQEDLIVDPWARPSAALDRAGSRSVVADGAALPSPPPEGSPLWAEGWTNPPAILPKKAISRPIFRPEPAAAPVHVGAVAWAKPVDMIVDPWESAVSSAVKREIGRDVGIVDPWLR